MRLRPKTTTIVRSPEQWPIEAQTAVLAGSSRSVEQRIGRESAGVAGMLPLAMIRCSLRASGNVVMVEVGPSSEENNPPAAEPQARHDFSGVQGFQVVGVEGHGAPPAAGDQAWRDALKLELEARAARLHQAVDAAIVLSNDGIIRWLGDPVARLSPGADILNPSAVILADESLPVRSRETVKTRIELWIAATTRRLLGPLFALEAIQEGPEIVQNLARDLARSLGILEREPIRAQINALAQNDRAELRKQGVRFGAYYLFVPALIKPAPRNLALQLWGLQARGDANDLLRTLGPVASSGRTSLAWDNAISKDGYRVAGYRPCGERVVRVDVVERLAGMVRAAIASEAPGAAPGLPNHRTAKGFVVSGEMTSLTGCSGDQFASILRSMGFKPVEMRRSDFFAPAPADGSPGESDVRRIGRRSSSDRGRSAVVAAGRAPRRLRPTRFWLRRRPSRSLTAPLWIWRLLPSPPTHPRSL